MQPVLVDVVSGSPGFDFRWAKARTSNPASRNASNKIVSGTVNVCRIEISRAA